MNNLTKVDRARILRRCRKPALSCMAYSSIANELDEISWVCQDLHYFCDDEKTLLDALDGDEDAEMEFQMAFSALDEKVSALQEAINGSEWAEPWDEDYDPEADFDACLVALAGDYYHHECGAEIWGFDAGEGDYFTLNDYDAEYACTEAGKRLCRKTKPQMLHSIQTTLRVFLAMIDIREEYDYLKAAFDIVKSENVGLLKAVSEIELAYEMASDASLDFRFQYTPAIVELDRLTATLPARCWVE